MFGLILAIAQASAQPAADDREIIIVGRRAEAALVQCLARGCPPAEEVEAALDASVEQFVGGRYVDARRTLQRTIRRTRAHAAELPGPVSSLHATLATVAQHEGDMDIARRAMRTNVQILDTHIGASHPAALAERLAEGDLRLLTSGRNGADAAYRAVAERAMAGGHRLLAAGAMFRRAWLSLAAGRLQEAERLGNEAMTAGGEEPALANPYAIFQARLASRRGDDAAIDALVQRIRQSHNIRPTLVFQPPLDNVNPDGRPGGPGSLPVNNSVNPDSSLRYADVGYWIRPDGRTAEVELLRTTGLGQWGPGILSQVQQRRYVPTDGAPGEPGVYRIDRFTVRGEMDVPTGSRIRRRMGDLSVHVIDLTETEAMAETRRHQMERTNATPAR